MDSRETPPTIERIGWEVDNLKKTVQENRDRIVVVEKESSKNTAEVVEARADVSDLKATLNRLTWAIVGLALTIAGGAIGLAIQIASSGSTP
jgi:chromosome segregation ATPase